MSRRTLARWAFALLLAGPAAARDAYVLLSGGGTPLINNYSQLLQARGVADHLRRTYPKDSVWIFFGAGNREGEPARLADVRRQVKENGLVRETWLPGVFADNRSARKAEFLRALREEILPAVRDGGTLYLFVGDHGDLAKTGPKESAITLWQWEKSGDGWRADPAEELTVTELRTTLAAGLGRGRVVFCMTQCHSGGFHFIGVPRVVRPPAAWFTEGPAWALAADAPPLPLVAGFTATDEESIAAGCLANPDPERWNGYERYAAEAWLGMDLIAGLKTGAGLPSYAAAHEAAVLVDQTVDKPRSSSEQFLESWAVLIEKLAVEKNLRPAVQAQVAAYGRAVDAGLAVSDDAVFSAKRVQFGRYVARMAEQNPTVGELIAAGPREKLEQAMGGKRTATLTSPPAGPVAPSALAQAWMETIRPQWRVALEGDASGALVPRDAVAFERHLLAREAQGADFMSPFGTSAALLYELYAVSGYALPADLDAEKAAAVTRWGAVRQATIYAWAKNSADPAVRAAAEKLAPPRRIESKGPTTDAGPTLWPNVAAGRTLFYRRTLAAWAFLLAMREEAALAQLHRLIELESTPHPAGAKAG